MNTFRKIAFAMLIIAIATSSSYSLADSKFATVDTVSFHDGNTILSTLTATEESSVQDGEITFNGNLRLTNEKRTVSLTATLSIDGDDKPKSIAIDAEDESQSVLAIIENYDGLQVTDYSLESVYDKEGTLVFDKSFFSIETANEEVSSSVVVTDDPLPVVGWLLLAGLGYLAAKDFYIIYDCESALNSQTDIDLSSLTFTSKLTCNGG